MITDLDDTVEFQDQHVVPQDRAGGPESLEYQDLAAHRNDTVPVQVEVRINKSIFSEHFNDGHAWHFKGEGTIYSHS